MKHNTIKKISQEEISRNQVEGNLPDKPSQAPLYGGRTLTPEEIKGFFDKLPKLIAERYNDLATAVHNGEFDGKSAYQYAVEYGYEGSEEEFGFILAELKTYKEYTDQHLFDHDEAISELQGANEQLYMIADEVLHKTDNHEKRITNLEKGLPADRFITDDSVAYIKHVPTNACPFAAVEKVGGMTSKCTNLLPYPYVDSTTTVQGVTFTDNGDGTITINGTTTNENAVFWLTNNLQLSAGTYRIVLREVSEGDGIILSIMKNGKWIYDTASSYNLEIADGDIIRLYLQVPKGKTASNKTFMPRVNKGETVLPFESYYEGLRNAKVTAIEVKGKNLYNEQESVDGYRIHGSAGTNYAEPGYAVSDYIPVIDNEQYTLSVSGKALTSGYLSALCFYDRKKATIQVVSSVTSTFTTPSGTAFVRFASSEARMHGNSEIGYIQLEKGNAVTPYAPFSTPNTFPIPTEVQNLDGYGEGAGTASNAIVWNEDGIAFEKRCKKITLTNDMATYRDIYAPNFRFGFTISDKAPSVGFVGNMVSNIAVLADPITTPTTAKEYSIAGSNSGGAVYVIVPNITSTADAIAYLNEHPIELWYETTSPESTDISDLITADNLIEVEGGGTLTFVNEHGAAVPSTILYQTKGE